MVRISVVFSKITLFKGLYAADLDIQTNTDSFAKRLETYLNDEYLNAEINVACGSEDRISGNIEQTVIDHLIWDVRHSGEWYVFK